MAPRPIRTDWRRWPRRLKRLEPTSWKTQNWFMGPNMPGGMLPVVWEESSGLNYRWRTPINLSHGALIISSLSSLVFLQTLETLLCSHFRFLMLETAQQLMECTTTSVTTSSTLPTKGIWGKTHRRAPTHKPDVRSHLLFAFLVNLTPVPSSARAHLSSCPSSLARLTRLDPPSHLSCVCSPSLKGVSDTICCLSVCHRLSTNRCLCQRGGGPRQPAHICQTCVAMAWVSCQVLITCDISHLLLGWWIACESLLQLSWPTDGQVAAEMHVSENISGARTNPLCGQS